MNEQKEKNNNTTEILEKYSKEENYRKNIELWAWVGTLLGSAVTIFHLYTVFAVTRPSPIQGAVHVVTALGIIFLLYPAKKGLQRKQKTVPWYDVVLAFTAMYVTYHKIFFFD